jgi:hypothetical protein
LSWSGISNDLRATARNFGAQDYPHISRRKQVKTASNEYLARSLRAVPDEPRGFWETVAKLFDWGILTNILDFDRTKTLVQLKREKFRDRSWDFHPFPSGYYLRHVPLEKLTDGDMWTLIRQAIGLDYLVCLALDRLETNPLIKARRTEGDLLSAVLCADALVWNRHPEYRGRVTALWRKVSIRLVAKQTPEMRMLFADYRWFLKAGEFLPPG